MALGSWEPWFEDNSKGNIPPTLPTQVLPALAGRGNPLPLFSFSQLALLGTVYSPRFMH